jgi:transcriptional regulator with XRE-family HTH domain
MKAEWFRWRLRELRLAAGLSRRKLSLAAGLGDSRVRDLEQGQAVPRWDTVLALAQVLGVATDEFAREPLCTSAWQRGRPRKHRGD